MAQSCPSYLIVDAVIVLKIPSLPGQHVDVDML